MKKIPTLFLRDPDNPARVIDEPHPDCGWVFAGEGVATVKWDGTACMFDGDIWWKRREVKVGKPTPEDFYVVGEANGKQQGWVPADVDDPADKWLWEAVDVAPDRAPGTFELVGPKVQGNPHRLTAHLLWRHGDMHVMEGPVSFDSIRDRLAGLDGEGIVWHHADGRMAKVKRRDFGLAWPILEEDG